MNLYPWGMFLFGGFTIGALIRWRSNVRERRLRAELIALVNAVVQATETDRPRVLQLAIARAWEVLSQ